MPEIKKEIETRLKGLTECALILYVMRTYTDKENPRTVKEIVEKMSEIYPDVAPDGEDIAKTVRRYLPAFVEAGNFAEAGNESLSRDNSEILYRVYGGRVCVTGTRPAKYYFEPILTAEDVSMICSAVESNHFLSVDEKEYLTVREAFACSYKEGFGRFYDVDEDEGMTCLPDRSTPVNALPFKSSKVLKKVADLVRAIREKKQIFVTSGAYAVAENSSNLVFVPKKKNGEVRPYVLDPYAMIFQNGQLYAIVTHAKYDNPTFFRVDRIFDLQVIEDSERSPVPERLEMFFDKDGRFNSELFTSIHPLMTYNDEEEIGAYEFTCKESALYLPVDYFGADPRRVRVCKDPRQDDHVIVEVNADLENVKRFCCQHHELVVPVYRPGDERSAKLVQGVLDSMLGTIDKVLFSPISPIYLPKDENFEKLIDVIIKTLEEALKRVKSHKKKLSKKSKQ